MKLIIMIILYIASCLNNEKSGHIEPDIYEPDKIMERIRDNIYQYATMLYKTDKKSLANKRIYAGDLPDSFPQEMKKNAEIYRQNKQAWDPVMLYPTSVWRVCIFPSFRINYVSYCKDKLGLDKSKIKYNGRYYFI
jgi:hypothetical protein